MERSERENGWEGEEGLESGEWMREEEERRLQGVEAGEWRPVAWILREGGEGGGGEQERRERGERKLIVS